MQANQIRDDLLDQLRNTLPNGSWFVYDPETGGDLSARFGNDLVCTVEDEVEPGKMRRVRFRLSLELVSDAEEDDFAD